VGTAFLFGLLPRRRRAVGLDLVLGLVLLGLVLLPEAAVSRLGGEGQSDAGGDAASEHAQIPLVDALEH
jgi:hypothetical protein